MYEIGTKVALQKEIGGNASAFWRASHCAIKSFQGNKNTANYLNKGTENNYPSALPSFQSVFSEALFSLCISLGLCVLLFLTKYWLENMQVSETPSGLLHLKTGNCFQRMLVRW